MHSFNHVAILLISNTAPSTTAAPAPAGGLFGSTPAASTTTTAAPAGGLFGAGKIIYV